MPLFDALEREVSSFFVAQGSVFDTIVKTLLDRITHVESRVDHTSLTLSKLLHENANGNTSSSSTTATTTIPTNDEMEYFVMTLARQLNVVLALLFRPYAHDAMAQTHARQQQLVTISDLLTENESILMGVATPAVSPTTQVPSSPAATDGSVELGSEKTTESDPLPNDSNVETSTNEELQKTSSLLVPPIADTGNGAVSSPSVQNPTTTASTFTMVHHLHEADQTRQRHDEELLQRMHKLLTDSQHASHSQCNARHAQHDTLLRELQHQNEKLCSESGYYQQQQQQLASLELLQAQLHETQQKELDRQLLAFSNTFLASQTTQEQQITRILDHLRECSDRFLSKNELDQLAATWLQTARADCVYGANPETLSQLQSNLRELQQMLNGETPSPALSRLQSEVQRVLELLEKLLELLGCDRDALLGTQGAEMMQTLCRLLSQLEELANTETAHPSASFLTTITRQMELGTANLLDAIEKQQERYQHTLAQQQAELEILKLDLQTQKLSDEELRRQLSACPSQEETMRLVNALRDQLQASSSDSASRVLDTVDDLRAKMAGLPTLDFLDELLHSKADRSEIDRLRLLLASNTGPTGSSAPSLSKSPTKCLSCDQSMPFMHSRPVSASATPHQNQNQNQSDMRPASAHTTGGGERGGSNTSSTSRPGSRSASPTRQSVASTGYHHHHHSVAATPQDLQEHHTQHQHHQHHQSPAEHLQNRFVSPFTRAMLLLSDHGGGGGGVPSTQEILRDLAATIDATKRRRQRLHDQQPLSPPPSSGTGTSTGTGKRKTVGALGTGGGGGGALGGPEATKNRFALRRTTLSDQVVYGPSITPGFLKPKKSISVVAAAAAATGGGTPGSARRNSSDDSKNARPKTAVVADGRRATTAGGGGGGGGGDVIMRTPTTTVVIRPFSEVAGSRDDRAAGPRRATRGAP